MRKIDSQNGQTIYVDDYDWTKAIFGYAGLGVAAAAVFSVWVVAPGLEMGGKIALTAAAILILPIAFRVLGNVYARRYVIRPQAGEITIQHADLVVRQVQKFSMSDLIGIQIRVSQDGDEEKFNNVLQFSDGSEYAFLEAASNNTAVQSAEEMLQALGSAANHILVEERHPSVAA